MRKRLSLLALLPFLGACGLLGAEDPLPEARFYVSCISIVDSNVHFVNRSLNASKYLWRFPDGRTSTEAEPTMVFTRSDSIDVTLEATNSDDEVNSVTHRVFIHPAIPAEKLIDLPGVSIDMPRHLWAIAVERILRHYGKEKSQCEMVSEYYQGNCCDPSHTCQSRVTSDVVTQELITHGPIASTTRSSIVALSELKSEIAQNNPVVLWYSGPDLYDLRIAYGYDADGNINTIDAYGNPHVVAYDDLLRVNNGTDFLEWTTTITCIRKPT